MARRLGAPLQRGLSGSALLAACLLTTSAAHAAEFDRRVLVKLGRSVLRIEAVGAQGRLQIGSGVVVGQQRVVTNCHVTRGARQISVTQAGQRWSVSSQCLDARRDLCLLQVPTLELPAVPLGGSEGLRQGQELAALGYGAGAGLAISGGSVVALHPWDGGHVIQCSNGFSSDASGGGLFDQQGRLVGVLTFRLPGGRSHYYAVPAEWLHENAGIRMRFTEPGGGDPAFWELPPTEQPWFLRAASFERAGQWQALLELTDRWAEADARDAEPFYLRAVAFEGLNRPDAAVEAWQRSLAIDPDYSRSWARLARLYHRSGRSADAQQAVDALTALNPGLALELSSELRSDPPSTPPSR